MAPKVRFALAVWLAYLALPTVVHAQSAITGVVLPVDGGWTAGEPALPW